MVTGNIGDYSSKLYSRRKHKMYRNWKHRGTTVANYIHVESTKCIVTGNIGDYSSKLYSRRKHKMYCNWKHRGLQ